MRFVTHLLPAQEQDGESARMERGDDIELEKKKHHKLLGIRRKLIRALLMPLLCLLFAAAAVTVYYLKYTLVRLAGLQRGGHEIAPQCSTGGALTSPQYAAPGTLGWLVWSPQLYAVRLQMLPQCILSCASGPALGVGSRLGIAAPSSIVYIVCCSQALVIARPAHHSPLAMQSSSHSQTDQAICSKPSASEHRRLQFAVKCCFQAAIAPACRWWSSLSSGGGSSSLLGSSQPTMSLTTACKLWSS